MARPILFLGDLHLGRRPVGLDGALEPLALSARQLSPAAALERSVELALDEKVRAVVFAGDLVDLEDDRYEAFPLLETAVRRLVAAGIAVFGVAGNHDTKALPRLADRIPDFTLLGRDGTWQLSVVPPRDPDDPPVDLLGWSFPARHVQKDPTEKLREAPALAKRREDARLVGVVHGDLDRPASKYAPLARANLAALGADAFLLGHIHAPDALSGPGAIGYLGSVCALDAGETGAHGPWLLHLEGPARLEQVPLSPIRHETLRIELEAGEAESADRLLSCVGARLAAHLGELDAGSARTPELIVVRAELHGRLEDRTGIRELAELTLAERHLGGEVPGVLERVVDRTRPAISLDRLAERATPVGHLARRILALEALEAPSPGDTDACADLLAAAREKALPWLGRGFELPAGAKLDPPLEARLLAAAWEALDRLLSASSEGAR